MNQSGKKSSAASVADREIVSVRVFAAPRTQVFGAFADPVQLARWWGPKDFTATIHEFDLRPGGRWRVTLHGPNGVDFANDKFFTEITAPERIVFAHRETGHDFSMAMTFALHGAGTQLTWRMRFESAADCARARELIRAANEQNFDRLAAHLAQLHSTHAQHAQPQ